MIEALESEYEIIHLDNCRSKWTTVSCRRDYNANETLGIDEVVPKVSEHTPNVLVSYLFMPKVQIRNYASLTHKFSASMWTAKEAQDIHSLAKSIVPDIKLHAILTGLQVERGPDAIVE